MKNVQPSKYYSTISELPLRRFIQVVVDNNIYALIITGKPTDDELYQAWEDIRSEYTDAIKDYESKMIISLEKELLRIKITYQQIVELIDVLKKVYTVQFARELNKLLKSSFKFDVTKPEEYDKELQNATNRSKGIKIEMDLKQINFDAIVSKRAATKSEKPTREYFHGILITLSDFAKYLISEDSITVFEFCERIRRLNQHLEKQTLKNGRRQRGSN